jgi:acyl-CoA thioesterase
MSESNPPTTDGTGRISPFLDSLGVTLISRETGQAVLQLRVDELHLRTRGIAHGGVIASLLDTAMGIAVATKLPESCLTVTAQLNVNFIRPAWKGENLQILGTVRHSGQTTAVAQGEIQTESGVLVATSSGTFAFLKDPDPASEHLVQTVDMPQ